MHWKQCAQVEKWWQFCGHAHLRSIWQFYQNIKFKNTFSQQKKILMTKNNKNNKKTKFLNLNFAFFTYTIDFNNFHSVVLQFCICWLKKLVVLYVMKLMFNYANYCTFADMFYLIKTRVYFKLALVLILILCFDV